MKDYVQEGSTTGFYCYKVAKLLLGVIQTAYINASNTSYICSRACSAGICSKTNPVYHEKDFH